MHKLLFNILFFSLLLITLSCKTENKITPNEFSIPGSIQSDGKQRSFLIHLPKVYHDFHQQNFPILFGFHGGGGSATQFESSTGLSEKADEENFIVVYPEGLETGILKLRTWNAGNCCGQNTNDDIAFISKLMDKVSAEYRVDPKRIYATGHSNGAMMSFRVANELSGKIAAIATSAGTFQIQEPYAPVRNIPVLHIASKLDENVPYEGGVGAGISKHYNPPADSCLTVIGSRSACTVLKQLVTSSTVYTQYRWSQCEDSDFEVLFYLTEDGGHSWAGGSSGSRLEADPPSKAIDATDVIWEFFTKHSLN